MRLISHVILGLVTSALQNEKDTISGSSFSTCSKILLIYIKNKIGDTGDLWEISVSTSFLGLLWLFIISWSFGFVRNNFVQQIRSLSIFNSSIWAINWVFEIWLKASFISINNVTANIFLVHLCSTLYTNDATTSIAYLSFWASIWSWCSFKKFFDSCDNYSVITFFTSLLIQLSKLITL